MGYLISFWFVFIQDGGHFDEEYKQGMEDERIINHEYYGKLFLVLQFTACLCVYKNNNQVLTNGTESILIKLVFLVMNKK